MASMTTMEDPVKRKLQVVFRRKMEERKIFMKELEEIRADTYRRFYRIIRKSVGPKWYQVLSTTQRKALDTFDICVYQDLLEGRPVRSMRIINIIGIYPRPNHLELLNCMYVGRHDPKEVLANLFLTMSGHKFSDKLLSYTLNGRLLLSSIYYLGLRSLIQSLKEMFKPDPPSPPPPKKPRPKTGPRLKSPYLQEMFTSYYEPKRPKRRPVFALPNLEHLNEPYDETPPVPKPPPPPPPPPPPKKRIPVSYCDRIAGYKKLEPWVDKSKLNAVKNTQVTTKKIRASKLCLADNNKKKVYGLGEGSKRPKKKGKRPIPPMSGYDNTQYQIQGVQTYGGRRFFIIGTVTVLPPGGTLIHGGYKVLGGEILQIHLGIKACEPPPEPIPCDCLQQYQDTVFKYVQESKCYCGHRYDYGHPEGTFPPDEEQYFQKPNKRTGFQFNYASIFETNPKLITIHKEFKKLWETDSFIHEEENEEDFDPEKEKEKKKKKIVKKSSKTCLGPKPQITDYLNCGLRILRRQNIAARLPDLHLAPELIAWMRNRIYGPYTKHQKNVMRRQSTTYWTYLKSFQNMGLGKCLPVDDPEFKNRTLPTWHSKPRLLRKFKRHIHNYKVKLYRAHSNFNNLFWATMFQAQQPDKRFREIFFDYLVSTVRDIDLVHPYSKIEVSARTTLINKKRMVCLEEFIPQYMD